MYIKAETRTDLCLLLFVAVLFIVAMCTINACVHQYLDAQTKGYLSIKWDTTRDLGRSDEGRKRRHVTV